MSETATAAPKIEYSKCPETGFKTVKATGLVPCVIVTAVPELGFLVGEIRGVLPRNAVNLIKNGFAYVHGEKPPTPAAAATAAAAANGAAA